MAYVYLHTKHNGEIFYVGKGVGYRAYDKSHRSEYWKRVVNKYGYKVSIFKDNISDEEALSLEKDLIDAIGLDNLVNFTKGGEGISGFKHYKETRRKIGLANSGGTSWSKGLSLEEAHKKKISESNKGVKRPRIKVYDPNNDVTYESMTDFCRKNNIGYSIMQSHFSGKRIKDKYKHLKVIKK